ncbi:hypothetical protein CUT44_21145 [Streptomyces carminius]|uniref:Uncharacterized protein n=1 Tax=Streptomyces carminius TaxID=2665496 RepID=A0A2M8LUZ6_9ACTN|nr:hypothetical protein [Streptomyces carminius]PJE95773.1 hypothetical protein CUT44_21145 [Streptomyces carminius]
MRTIVDSAGATVAVNAAEPRHEEFHAVPSRASSAVAFPLVVAEAHRLPQDYRQIAPSTGRPHFRSLPCDLDQ